MARILGTVSATAAADLETLIRLSSTGPVPAGLEPAALAPGDGVRLAALDRQPSRYVSAGAGLHVVIDGGIYNRDELGAAESDAALIGDLYRRHGFEGLLARLNGDFAIALYDSEQKRLWLARDRLGVKPLYYAQRGDAFAFCSRPRPLTALPQIGASINRRFAAVFAAGHYRYFDNVPHESPYERVAQLPAAHWLCVEDGKSRTGCYWRLEDAEDFAAPEEELAERYRELLLSAVECRLKASAAPGFTLSGGMDSSSVLASARHLSGEPQRAFSAVYSDKTYDESEEIRPMIEHAVSAWQPIRVDDPDVFSIVRDMVAANDEPVATATWLAHYVLCKEAAAQGVDTLFGGLGGDELNAGEYEYFFFYFADLARAGDTVRLDAEIDAWAAHHDHPIYRKSRDVAFSTMARCTDPAEPGRCLPDAGRMRRYFDVLSRDFYDLEQFVPIMERRFASYLKTRSYQDLSRETAPCCLRAEDRQTQAFGLENHVPFFDYRLIEFMFRVPGTMKIRGGVTKILLREATRGILPDETRTRIKKTGWNAPAHVWFTGRGLEMLRDLVGSRAFRERGIYDAKRVKQIIDEHSEIVASNAPRENHMMFLWQLVNLELWLQSL